MHCPYIHSERELEYREKHGVWQTKKQAGSLKLTKD